VGVYGARAPPALSQSPLPALQDLNFYGYSFANASEWGAVRCALDFSNSILSSAWDFAGPRGPLRGEPFFALHARLEDFSYSFPGEDTAPQLDVFVAHGARLARRAGLQRVFLTTNGNAEERAAILAQLRGAGLEAHAHPGAADWGFRPSFVDAAIAGFGAALLGNMQSTYSWMIGHTMLCAGVGAERVHFFSKRAADALAAEMG
jgi:hypothetical protein